MRHELVDRAARGNDSLRLAWAGVLRGLQVGLHEVLLLSVLDLRSLLLAQLVIQASADNSRNLVLRMRASDLISPLHLLGLNYETADFLLSILRWCE